MKKRIIKMGNSQGILFTIADMNNYGMKLGDIIDLDDMFLEDVVSKRKNCKKLPKIKSNKEMLKQIKKEIKQ